jgi:hypothetical protein
MTGIVPRHLWPHALRHRAIRGVYVGGCCAGRHGVRLRAKSHVHTGPAGHRFRGWVCMREARWLKDRMLCLHERAHAVTGEQQHTARWRRYLLRIGGTVERTASMRAYGERCR